MARIRELLSKVPTWMWGLLGVTQILGIVVGPSKIRHAQGLLDRWSNRQLGSGFIESASDALATARRDFYSALLLAPVFLLLAVWS